MKNQAVRELLSKELYEIVKLERVSHPDFEQINYFGDTFSLFDDMTAELKRPPNQHEYIQEFINRAKAFFTAPQYIKNDGTRKVKAKGITYSFIWNEELAKAVIQRANRTYQSLMVEYTTALQIKELFPDSKILMSPLIDTCFGSDLVVFLDGKVTYIHIHSDTYWGHQGFINKAKRKGYARDNFGESKFWHRDWSVAHVPLAFGREENTMTDIVNGNPLFKEEKLKEFIEGVFSQEGLHEKAMTGKSSIEKFLRWCNYSQIGYNENATIL